MKSGRQPSAGAENIRPSRVLSVCGLKLRAESLPLIVVHPLFWLHQSGSRGVSS